MKTVSDNRAQQIARNINAMDVHYKYIDNLKEWKFWDRLNTKLKQILSELTDEDKYFIYSLCGPIQAEFFGLVPEPQQTEETTINNTIMKTFRSKVFKRAYEIMKATRKSFAVCLSKSWALYRLQMKLRTKEKVEFAYEKKDGSLRRAIGTLRNVDGMIKGTGAPSIETLRYYDLEATAFRSFRVENLVTVF